MSDLTFESDCRTARETYEWDRTWWEHTENTDAPRVFYIGDSISWEIRPVANRLLDGRVLIDALATSKALDDPFFADTLRLFARQTAHCELILFNNGLHGFHLDDGAYAGHYRAMLDVLKEIFPGVPTAVVLTTHVADPDTEQRVAARNRAALGEARARQLPVIDLYTLSDTLKDRFRDGVHFQPEAYRVLGEHLAARIQDILQ